MSPQQNSRLSTLSICVGLALSAAAAVSSAQGTSSQGTSSSAMGASSGGTVAAADKAFATKAAIGGLAEVQMGQLAQQKGSSDQVKQFGSRMVDDHTKANDELKQIASSKGITLPADLDAKHKSKMDKMQKLSGAQFDKAYMDDMVADHKEDVADFRKEAKSGKDSDIKGFAAKTLPTLEDHLKMAQSTDSAVKSSKSASR
jgi:putative membrane protein